MREIKFRGKRLSANEWVYGYYVPYHVPGDDGLKEIPAIYNDGKGRRNDLGYWKNVDEETVGQFTGLYDKNGKEIYEGDILSADYYPFVCDGKMNYVAIIEWFEYDACWYAAYDLHKDSTARGISIGCPSEFNEDTVRNYIVIGNIHDNPELLREEGKQ